MWVIFGIIMVVVIMMMMFKVVTCLKQLSFVVYNSWMIP